MRVFCVCLSLYVHGICAWVFLPRPLICLFCMRLCEYSCVIWSDFSPPGMGIQNLSTFQRSFILVLVLAQYSHWVTQWEVYLPACGRRHRNITLWRWLTEKLSVSVTLSFILGSVYFHTCSPHVCLGDLTGHWVTQWLRDVAAQARCHRILTLWQMRDGKFSVLGV